MNRRSCKPVNLSLNHAPIPDSVAASVRIIESKSADPRKSALQRQIVANQFEDLELNCLRWLLPKVPRESSDREELKAQIRYYCFEAVDLFKPELNVPFCAFLKLHVRQRTMSLQGKLWRRSSGNKACRMLQMSQHVPEGRGAALADDDSSLARDSGFAAQFGVNDDPAKIATMNEFLSALTAQARSALDQLLACADQDTLCESFNSRRWRSRVYTLSRLSKSEVDTLVREVREKMPKFVELGTRSATDSHCREHRDR
jgi:hypothetical protein